MELMISGYGNQPKPTMSMYTLTEKAQLISEWETSIENPSYLCKGDGYVFTVTEADEYAFIYSYQRTDSGYELVDKRKIEGGALCHITYSAKNKALFGACYGTGTIFALRVKDGEFKELFHQEIQGTPVTRAHCVLLNSEEDLLYTVNIALDCIFVYQITQKELIVDHVLQTPKGSGPRHIVLSETEELLYVITEYSNEILLYENGGAYRLLQKISTLPQGYTGFSNCSTLCFSKGGRFLYAANRGADTIALFSVAEDGLLERITEYDCGGKHPRHMLVTDDGKHLIICNQHSNLVSALALNTETGEISGKEIEISFPAPSGILEL